MSAESAGFEYLTVHGQVDASMRDAALGELVTVEINTVAQRGWRLVHGPELSEQPGGVGTVWVATFERHAGDDAVAPERHATGDAATPATAHVPAVSKPAGPPPPKDLAPWMWVALILSVIGAMLLIGWLSDDDGLEGDEPQAASVAITIGDTEVSVESQPLRTSA